MSNSATPEPGAERTLRSTTRNPRRRPRQSDADSQRTAPRRKRSKISENTFVPPRHDEEAEEEINGTIEVATMNGHVETPSPKRGRGRPRKDSAPRRPTPQPPPLQAPPMLDIEMPMRTKKTSVKRPTKGDGATVLAQNTRYSVKQLPSTPKELKRDAVEFRGSIGAGTYALAVTREKAYIWDYTSHTPVNNPKVFDVPFAVKPTDVLPFGALVTAGATTDIGLVLFSATNGKIHYFESIERAASLGLFQERNNGIDGSIGNLFSGEVITDIVSAQHAGFVVTCSSGRLAQVTLRDQQGRARIAAQFLRAAEQSSGGLFGSIKGFLTTGAWKRDVAAVHIRQLGARGQMQVISLTERAELQIWDLDWNSQHIFKGTIDFAEPLKRELRKAAPIELQGKEDFITTLDFTILEPPSNSTAVATLGAELPLDMTVLLRSGPADHQAYALATISIEGRNVEIPQVLCLTSYHDQSATAPMHQPRLLLPKPKHTALVAFNRAVLLKQLDESEANSPEAQLRQSYMQPDTFEDSLYLKQDQKISILDACAEIQKGGPESAIFFVRGAGLVRVTIADPKELESEQHISVKNKIEQAVFHGVLQDDNVIDFSLVSNSTYSPDEVEAAVLSISEEILRSTSPFISTDPTSIEAHFAYKAQALRALVAYARQNFPTLSQAAMWRLLWDAERVAAGLQLSKVFEEHVESAWQTKRKGTVLDQVCETMQESTRDTAYAVSDNPVRNFWIGGLDRLAQLLQEVVRLVDNLASADDIPSHTKIRLLREANDVFNAALETTFAFRTEHAAAYGILSEFLEHGILIDAAEYAELREFWTSTRSMVESIIKFANLSRSIAKVEFEKIEHDNDEQAANSRAMVAEISENNPNIIELLCSMFQERIHWLASRPSERERADAEDVRAAFDACRHQQIRTLADIGQSEAGMKLAEQYKDMQTLAETVIAEEEFIRDTIEREGPHSKEKMKRINDYVKKTTARTNRYFQEFGDNWANAYFETALDSGEAGLMFQKAQANWPGALSQYLHADASRAKLSWINDVDHDQDFSHASESLILTAQDQEGQLWAKKVELSLGKLSLLAKQEELRSQSVDVPQSKAANAIPDRQLEIVEIQERLYWHLVPEITHCIDHEAEVEVAMQKFANKIHDLQSLRQLLQFCLDRVLDRLVLTTDELVDTLTLLDNSAKESTDNRDLNGEEFFLALKVLNAIAVDIPQDQFETMLQMIWKRCYIHDDWVDINNRQKQSDDEVREKLRQTAAWKTMMYAAESGLFNSPSCHVRQLLPSECLGAGCKPDDLLYRWERDILENFLQDNKIQDEVLVSYVADRNLDSWIEACISDVKQVQEEKAEQKAQALETEREFEVAVQQAKTNGNQNGHMPNGLVKNGTSIVGEAPSSDVDANVDTDVDMG